MKTDTICTTAVEALIKEAKDHVLACHERGEEVTRRSAACFLKRLRALLSPGDPIPDLPFELLPATRSATANLEYCNKNTWQIRVPSVG